jgi:hypothetical protein
MGHTRYTAPNPPEGAILAYYVNPALMGAEEDNAKREVPRIELDILDDEGEIVRRLNPSQGAEGAGIQRLVWDLRHPLAYEPEEENDRRRLKGPFVLPGTYKVRLSIDDDEHVKTVDVRRDPAIDISVEHRRILHDTLQSLNQMLATSRAILSTTKDVQARLKTIGKAIETHGDVPESVHKSVEEIRENIDAILVTMEGEETGGGATLPGAPPLAARVRQLYVAIEGATALPTTEQRQLTQLSHEQLMEQIDRVNDVTDKKLPTLERHLDDAGVAWTPGRPVNMKSK